MLSQTTTRVQRTTAEAINQRIAQETEERIRHYAAHPQQIDRRLRELDAEWDMERTLETNAAGIAFLGNWYSARSTSGFCCCPRSSQASCCSTRCKDGVRRCHCFACAGCEPRRR